MDLVQQWTFIAQLLQGIGQVGSVVVAVYAVHLVQRYTRKKDQADFIRNRWNEQANINIACLTTDDVLFTHERMVYGEFSRDDLDTARERFAIFCVINQMLHLYMAMKHDVLTEKDYHVHALGSAKLLKRRKAVVAYLLRERGYPPDFARDFLPLLDQVEAPKLPEVSLPVSRPAERR